MQAIILSGGKGTRLHPLTLDTPKPMLPINGIPHLEYQIRLLKDHGFKDIIFSTGYLHKQIEDYFGDGSRFGVEIRYKEDGDKPLGTGGAIRNCLDLIKTDKVLILNGDILTNINLTEMKHEFLNNPHINGNFNPLMIALVPVDDPTAYGVARVNNGLILDFVEKPKDNYFGNLINAGIYMMYRDIIKYGIKTGFSMIETTVFPFHVDCRCLTAYCASKDYYWLDIGTHERYTQAQVDSKNFFQKV